jgi:hypothetical protein
MQLRDLGRKVQKRLTPSRDDLPLPSRLPPKPPEPRMNTVDWFSKMILPVVLSFISTIVVTAAAFPLSKTSRSLAWLTSSPLVGIGALMAR